MNVTVEILAVLPPSLGIFPVHLLQILAQRLRLPKISVEVIAVRLFLAVIYGKSAVAI